MSSDLGNNAKASVAWAGATINSDTNTDGASIIDMSGYESVMFLVHSGTRTDGSYLLKIMESDESNGSSPSEVPNYQVQETLEASNVVKKVSAKPTKRYCFVRITSTSTSSGCVFKGGQAIQSGARHAPT